MTVSNTLQISITMGERIGKEAVPQTRNLNYPAVAYLSATA